jgi:photosystem II stability/assembly factor-like uncharacterized protein
MYRATWRTSVAAGVAVFDLLTASPVHAAGGTVGAQTSPSAIGDQAPLWIAVSPDYARSHMVAALSASMGTPCSGSCTHLWVTRDGGASWHIAPQSRDSARLLVLSDSSHDAIVTQMADTVARSDDDGVTWRALGAAGTPSAAPLLGPGAIAVAVAGAADYVADRGVRSNVDGSSGAYLDLDFAVAPAPSPSHAAALLAAADRVSGADVVLQCNARLHCDSPAPLPGASGDVSLQLRDDYTSSGVVLARTAGALYRSTNGGHSFLPLTLPSRSGAVRTAVAGATLTPMSLTGRDGIDVALIDVVTSGTAIATAGGVFQTDNGGAAWHEVGGGSGLLDGGATAIATTPRGRLFAGYVTVHGEAGLLCSEDGQGWRASCQTESVCVASGCALDGSVHTTIVPASTRVAGGIGMTARSTPATSAGQEPLGHLTAPAAQRASSDPHGSTGLGALGGAALAVSVLAALSRLRRRRR